MNKDTAMTKQESEEMIQQLKKIFEVVRLLDVETLETGNLKNKTDAEGFPFKCYNFWKKNTCCKNCSSREALNKKSEILKLEYLDSKIYQVISKYIEIDGKPYVMEMINAMKSDAIMDDDSRAELIKQLSGYNRELYTDALTGIYNRRYYEERIKNSDMEAGIAMIDLDDFKIYNDTYGHHAGDLVLETVARVIRNCIRQTDTLIRFGGDEFLLLLPGIPAEKLPEKLEQIRSSVHEAQVPGYTHLRPSVSIGGVLQTLADPIEAVVRRADLLMYQAKNRKNAVVVADPQAEPEDPEQLPQQKQQILIVDDSAMNRAILSEILQQDYRILEAANGEEALERLNQYSGDIALVLLDLIMPGMDGFAVLDFMTRNHTIEDVPVIMISSEDSEESIRRAYEMGASDYVNRPFDSKVVYRRVYNTIKVQFTRDYTG